MGTNNLKPYDAVRCKDKARLKEMIELLEKLIGTMDEYSYPNGDYYLWVSSDGFIHTWHSNYHLFNVLSENDFLNKAGITENFEPIKIIKEYKFI